MTGAPTFDRADWFLPNWNAYRGKLVTQVRSIAVTFSESEPIFQRVCLCFVPSCCYNVDSSVSSVTSWWPLTINGYGITYAENDWLITKYLWQMLSERPICTERKSPQTSWITRIQCHQHMYVMMVKKYACKSLRHDLRCYQQVVKRGSAKFIDTWSWINVDGSASELWISGRVAINQSLLAQDPRTRGAIALWLHTTALGACCASPRPVFINTTHATWNAILISVRLPARGIICFGLMD